MPLDTADYTRYYRNVMAKGTINRYVVGYVDGHRKELRKEYRDDADYVKRFNVSDEMLQKLYDMATADGVEFDAGQAAQSRPLFSMIIKALIGRDIFENATYFKVYNTYDPIFREAISLIKSPDYDRLLREGEKR